MPIVLDATIGGSTTNTYNLIADLDAAAALLFPAPVSWGTANSDTQNRAAVMAARILDRERFPGERATDLQAREWPRAKVRKPDARQRTTGFGPGFYLTTEIPPAIPDAHAQLTFFLVDQVALGIDPFA